GDFTVDLPERSFGANMETGAGGGAVSLDGHLAVIASREGATQAMVVDLRTRTLRGAIHYPPGWPRFVFSADGQRVYAAALSNGTGLDGWRLPADDAPKEPRWWTFGVFSRSGESALLMDSVSGRFELFRPASRTPILQGVHLIRAMPHLVGDLPRVAFIGTEK